MECDKYFNLGINVLFYAFKYFIWKKKEGFI